MNGKKAKLIRRYHKSTAPEFELPSVARRRYKMLKKFYKNLNKAEKVAFSKSIAAV